MIDSSENAKGSNEKRRKSPRQSLRRDMTMTKEIGRKDIKLARVYV